MRATALGGAGEEDLAQIMVRLGIMRVKRANVELLKDRAASRQKGVLSVRANADVIGSSRNPSFLQLRFPVCDRARK